MHGGFPGKVQCRVTVEVWRQTNKVIQTLDVQDLSRSEWNGLVPNSVEQVMKDLICRGTHYAHSAHRARQLRRWIEERPIRVPFANEMKAKGRGLTELPLLDEAVGCRRRLPVLVRPLNQPLGLSFGLNISNASKGCTGRVFAAPVPPDLLEIGIKLGQRATGNRCVNC